MLAIATLVEVLGSFHQIGVAHHVVSHLDLGTVWHNFFVGLGLSSDHHLRSYNHILLVERVLVLPLNLELGHSGLLHQDVASQLAGVYHTGWVFDQICELFCIGIVDIVPHSEELLGVVVAACQQDGSHSDCVVWW